MNGIALRLTETEALDGLIGGMSVQDPSFAFVVPGDSASSLIFLKFSMVDLGHRPEAVAHVIASPVTTGLRRDA